MFISYISWNLLDIRDINVAKLDGYVSVLDVFLEIRAI